MFCTPSRPWPIAEELDYFSNRHIIRRVHRAAGGGSFGNLAPHLLIKIDILVVWMPLSKYVHCWVPPNTAQEPSSTNVPSIHWSASKFFPPVHKLPRHTRLRLHQVHYEVNHRSANISGHDPRRDTMVRVIDQNDKIFYSTGCAATTTPRRKPMGEKYSNWVLV